MNKKNLKIKNDIVLSVKYARLKEEVKHIKLKKQETFENKGLKGFIEKRIDKSEELIYRVEQIIDSIKDKSVKSDYMLVINNEMENKLATINNTKDAELNKYSIAMEVLIDDEFNYSESNNKSFIPKISTLLFNNSTTMDIMLKDYNEILKTIKGVISYPNLVSAAKAVVNIAGKVINPGKSIVKKEEPIVESNIEPAKLSNIMSKRLNMFSNLPRVNSLGYKKQTKTISRLDIGELAKKLAVSAMNLTYAESHFEYIKDYKKYFNVTYKEINDLRNKVVKELFEEHKEVETNTNKLQLINNFDQYMIDQMNIKRINKE